MYAHPLCSDVCFVLVNSCYSGKHTHMECMLFWGEKKRKRRENLFLVSYSRYSQCIACSVESKLLLVLKNVIQLYIVFVIRV